MMQKCVRSTSAELITGGKDSRRTLFLGKPFGSLHLQLVCSCFFKKNKCTVMGVSQHGCIAGKSCQTNLIAYANEITISLDSINLSGFPEGFNKILHDGLWYNPPKCRLK